MTKSAVRTAMDKVRETGAALHDAIDEMIVLSGVHDAHSNAALVHAEASVAAAAKHVDGVEPPMAKIESETVGAEDIGPLPASVAAQAD